MEVSKFKIGNNIIDVKDAQARDDVIAAMNAAQDAQSTADLKLNTTDAWKCGMLTRTFNNITIAAGAIYDFIIDVPDIIKNAFVVNARCVDNTRPLIPINIYRDETKFHINMYNTGSSISSATIGIQIVCLYQ